MARLGRECRAGRCRDDPVGGGAIRRTLDVYVVDPEDPQGQVSLARIGPESVPKDMEAGDMVDLHYLLGVVTQITMRTQ